MKNARHFGIGYKCASVLNELPLAGEHRVSNFLDEETRIRRVYDLRRSRLEPSRYSLFEQSHLLSLQQVEYWLVRMLYERGYRDLVDAKLLEIGCGSGYWLRNFLRLGAQPKNLYGVDLQGDLIDEARALSPAAMHFECRSASELNFDSNSFDFVAQFTVFTSILSSSLKGAIAKEMLRILRPGGYIIWYDFHVNNPANRDVRGVSRKEITDLFGGKDIDLERVTIAPPVARLIAPSPLFYQLLSRTRILCSHYVGLIRK
ncbi:MAG TPA: class I SAM-dependent methyltransferase [Terriglobales bacterium]|nr:class I SAM-dependent methyltransferase [Terriglobales bacterium]